MVEPYLVVCAVLLLGSVLARALPAQRISFDDDYEDGWDLSPRELAYLRRGRYGLVLTVLAELHGAGAVDLSQPGRVRQLDPPHDYDDPLAITVYAGLNWCLHPRLVALLPSVRRVSRGIRTDLVERALLAPPRRRIFAAALLVYAVGLAVATMVERAGQGSTLSSAVLVATVAAVLCLGPGRTLAGRRELQLHRRSLRAVIAGRSADAAYLADLVAVDGWPAVEVLCGRYVAVGALAPRQVPVPVATPAPVPVPRVVALPVGWRRSIYETISDGPAIAVRPAFVPAAERVAA
jgi:uncharacterized protein (TIGR04222 family)